MTDESSPEGTAAAHRRRVDGRRSRRAGQRGVGRPSRQVETPPHEDGEAPATSDPIARTLVGHEVLGVETQTYPPGHAEAWEDDIGLHAVFVIAGTLTVHSSGPTPTSYGPGQGYVAGWAPHLAVNDGSVPVEVVISRLAGRQA